MEHCLFRSSLLVPWTLRYLSHAVLSSSSVVTFLYFVCFALLFSNVRTFRFTNNQGSVDSGIQVQIASLSILHEPLLRRHSFNTHPFADLSYRCAGQPTWCIGTWKGKLRFSESLDHQRRSSARQIVRLRILFVQRKPHSLKRNETFRFTFEAQTIIPTVVYYEQPTGFWFNLGLNRSLHGRIRLIEGIAGLLRFTSPERKRAWSLYVPCSPLSGMLEI